MDNAIVKAWLDALVHTANARDLDAHMALISKKVQVYGVPGAEAIGYEDWRAQCRHEFEHGILENLRYDGIHVKVITPRRIMFETRETVQANDGTVQVMDVDIMLEREPDDKWRVIQEQVNACTTLPPGGRRH